MSFEFVPASIIGNCHGSADPQRPSDAEIRQRLAAEWPFGIPAPLLRMAEGGALALNEEERTEDVLMPSLIDYAALNAERDAERAKSRGGGAFDGPSYSTRWTPPSVYMDDEEKAVHEENARRMHNGEEADDDVLPLPTSI